MGRYVAFLRGINVGGHNKIKMEELRREFGQWGFENVKTLSASGNVVFDCETGNVGSLAKDIEDGIRESFGLNISVIVRSLEEIQSLLNTDPFQGIEVTRQTRLYVSFLGDKPQTTLKVPYESSEGNFKILRLSDSEVCSVLTVTSNTGTTDGMEILEKEFGRNITTRNWNTVVKVAQL